MNRKAFYSLPFPPPPQKKEILKDLLHVNSLDWCTVLKLGVGLNVLLFVFSLDKFPAHQIHVDFTRDYQVSPLHI